MSVSELKERGQFTDDGESDFLPTLPDFMKEGQQTPKDGAAGGVFRGTAYHRILELLSFRNVQTDTDLEQEMERIRGEQMIDEKAFSVISQKTREQCFRSETAKRMIEADCCGKLHKESQFVMGIPAYEMDEADSGEPVLIQGIIDAWFEEEDGVVLVDYKTDRIQKGQEAVLLERYRLQMIYYDRALLQLTGKRVKEAIIYSLALQKEIPVPIQPQE